MVVTINKFNKHGKLKGGDCVWRVETVALAQLPPAVTDNKI